MNDKAYLRKQIRSLYPGDGELARQSSLICRRILCSDVYQNARCIGGYMPLPKEADVTPVIMDALRSGRMLALPLCSDAPYMTLRRITSTAQLRQGRYGIWEPVEETEIIPVSALDVLLTPLEGIDRRGMRLGKGGGYYDCLLSEASVLTLGCALSWQWVDHVPSEAWDVPLAACADMHGVHFF